MAGVAAPLVGRERVRRLDREAVPLPVGEAAGERGDVLVAELLQRLRGERGARAAGAVEDELASSGRGRAPRSATRAGRAGTWTRAGDGALLPFLALAHVDEERLALALARLGRADLVDLGLTCASSSLYVAISFVNDSAARVLPVRDDRPMRVLFSCDAAARATSGRCCRWRARCRHAATRSSSRRPRAWQPQVAGRGLRGPRGRHVARGRRGRCWTPAREEIVALPPSSGGRTSVPVPLRPRAMRRRSCRRCSSRARLARRRDRVRELRPRGADRRGGTRPAGREPLLRGDDPARGARARRARSWSRCGAATGSSRTRTRARSAGLYVDLAPPSLRLGAAARRGSVRLRPVPDARRRARPPGSPSSSRPLVYATIGTVFNEPEVFRALLDGLDGRGRRALVTVGRERRPGGARRRSRRDVRVERFVPQADVLPRARRRGLPRRAPERRSARSRTALPLVLVPQARGPVRERRPLPRRPAPRVVLRPAELTAEAVARRRSAASSSEPAFAEAAARIAAEIEAMPTADEVAAAVEEYVARVARAGRVSARARTRAGRRRARGRSRRAVVAGRRCCRRTSSSRTRRRGGAAAARGLPAARALARRPRRRRGARPAARGPSSTRPAGATEAAPDLRAATTRSRRSSAPPSPPGRRATTGSSSSARSIRAARSSSCTSGSPASGPGRAAR